MQENATARPLYRAARQAASLGLGVNLVLGAVKLAGGIIGNSFALLSDAVNSLGDCLTSIVVLFALRVAQLPADEEHPYGHTRAEAIAASNVALVVILSAGVIAWEAMLRLRVTHEAPPVWTLWIAGSNVVIKESLYRYKASVGRHIGSASVIANAWDHRSDALCSLAVLVSLATVRWGGPGWSWADDVAALIVASAIVWSGVQLFRRSASELMDPQASAEIVHAMRDAASNIAGVAGIEKLWVRKTGLEYLADIHIQVDGQLTVAEGHRIGHDVKDQLLKEFPALRDVLVHLEPYPKGA